MYLVGPAGFFCAGACFPGRVAYTPHLSGNGINKEFDMATHPLAGHPAPLSPSSTSPALFPHTTPTSLSQPGRGSAWRLAPLAIAGPP